MKTTVSALAILCGLTLFATGPANAQTPSFNYPDPFNSNTGDDRACGEDGRICFGPIYGPGEQAPPSNTPRREQRSSSPGKTYER